MDYYVSKEDKFKRAEKISTFLIDFKHRLDTPEFRTIHNLNKWKFYKNKYSKILSSFGYKLNLETEELRELIPMKIKVTDLKKQQLSESLDMLEMTKRKYNTAKQELIKAKENYNQILKEYKSRANNEKIK